MDLLGIIRGLPFVRPIFPSPLRIMKDVVRKATDDSGRLNWNRSGHINSHKFLTRFDDCRAAVRPTAATSARYIQWRSIWPPLATFALTTSINSAMDTAILTYLGVLQRG
jgi:hypothetical protein